MITNFFSRAALGKGRVVPFAPKAVLLSIGAALRRSRTETKDKRENADHGRPSMYRRDAEYCQIDYQLKHTAP